MDIILIQPPRYKRPRNKRSQPQMGLLYIGSYLLSKGYNVKVIDGEVNSFSLDEIVEKINSVPLAVGITTPCEDRFNAIELCKKIKFKFKDTLIIAGGPHFGYSAEDALKNVPEIDVVVIGEGELTTFEILERFSKNKKFCEFHGVKGCAFREETGKIIINLKRDLIVELDQLPPARWDIFEIDKYHGTLSVEEKTRAIGIISSRGCPYLCSFCSNSLNRKIRYRNPKLFVDEIQYLHEEYRLPGFNIQDDSFTANISHVKDVCEEILRRNLRIKWYCSLRVNKATYELLLMMKEAGCIALGYGIESGSDEVLKAVHKGTNTTMIRNAVINTKKAGLKYVSLFLMTSLPGQTRENIIEGSQFVNQMYNILRNDSKKKTYLGTPTLIYPGTEVEMLAKKNSNVFPPGFSWNLFYETERAVVFGSNRFVPHFENPDLSLEDIKNIFPPSPLYRLVLSLGKYLLHVRTYQDFIMIITRMTNYLNRAFKVTR